MELNKNRVECQRCHQGWVRPIYIRSVPLYGYLCDECEACWIVKEINQIQWSGFIDFQAFLESKGLDYDRSVFEYLVQT